MAARRKAKPEAPSLPPSHLEAIDAAGFEVLRYQNIHLPVLTSDGNTRNEWLPAEFINWEKRQFVRWSTDDAYPFPGWEPQEFRQFGGRYKTVQGALGWFEWRRQQMRP